jgi:DNA-directed RNA polymerase subunit H (RpoH/RPB5)
MDDEPNDANIIRMNYLYDHLGYFIVIHNIKRLQFNISNHQLVPKMTILSQEETDFLMKEKKITDLSQLPEISRYDPQALSLCLRPKQVCKIERDSVTALKCNYYRVCV